MAILSFKKRFAGKVRNGSKRQTIRAHRKYPIFPGDKLYLYTGLRTKYAKKLREVVCKSVTYTTILFYAERIDFLYQIQNGTDVALIGSITDIDGLNAFAKRDGFKDWEDMKEFWIQEHGVKKGKRKKLLYSFSGILIRW